MTDLLSDVDAPSDAELISRVRGGDVAAYGDLFSRHKDAANRLARQLVRGPDSDDLVAEAFAKVLSVVQGGGGPDVAFRAYLLTAVRRLHVDRVRSGQRLQTTDDMTPFDPGVPFQDTAVEGFESGAAAKAFASLPERWQLVLWHLEVEGQKPADIAPLLGMSANSVSALAYRAREGLRQAFLTMHIADLTETDCRWVNEHLGAFIRKGLSKRDAGKVQAHLDDCRRCTAMYLELTEVNSNLAGIIAPLLLGAAASGYLASGGAGAAGLLGLVSKVKELVGANTGAVTAAGVAVAVAAAATVAAVALGGGGGPGAKDAVLSDPSVAASTPAGPASGPASSTTPSSPDPTDAAPTASASASGLLAPLTSTAPTDAPAALASDSPSESPADGTSGTPDEGSTGNPSGNPTDGPTTGPTGGPAQPSAVDLSGTTIDDNGVNFRAVGSPALPPTMTVRLLSNPTGMTFDPASGDCDVAADGLSAVCSTVSGSGGRAPGTARMVAPTSYDADLPFSDEGPDTAEVSVTVDDLPDGFELTGGSGTISSHNYVRTTVDAALSLGSATVRPAEDDVYSLTGTLALSGPSAARIPTVTYTVTGGTFLKDGTSSSTVSRPASETAPDFQVVPTDTTDPAVSVAVGVAAPYRDTDHANDAAQADLAPYDISLSDVSAGTDPADAQGDQRFTATLDTDDFPVDAHPLVFALVDPAAGDELLSTEVTGHTVAFTVRSTSTVSHPVAFRVALPTGWTDADDTNNSTGTATWTPAPPPSDHDVDATLVALTPPVARPGPADTYTLHGLVDVSGPAADDVDTLTYTVAGGSFVTGPGCTATECTLANDGTPDFQVVPDDPAAASTVSITVHVPAPFHDTDVDDNSASVTLQRYDANLTDLTPVTPTADADGDQQFTADFASDGLAGVTFALTDGPSGASLTAGPATDGAVTFTVHAPSTTGADQAVPLTITAVLPTGYTDADAADNSATAVFTGNTDVDVAFDLASTPVRPLADDRYPVTGTTTVAGPASGALTSVTYTVTGGSFVDGSTPSSTTTRPASDTSPEFVVVPADPASPAVTIAASVPAPFHDTAVGNDSDQPVLGRYDVRLTDLVAAPGTADDAGDQTFTATLDDDGLSGLTYTVDSDDPTDELVSVDDTADGTRSFTVRSSATTGHDLSITVHPPSGWTDADPTDNTTASATWLPAPVNPTDRDVDISLISLTPSDARPGTDDTYTLGAMVGVTGDADGLDTIRYTIDGGSFVTGQQCTATECTRSDTGPPSFLVRPDDPAVVSTVTITAHPPTGFHDTDTSDNSASATLRRYDVGLTGLQAAPGTADANGDQVFTATLRDDDQTGLTYTLDGAAPGDSIQAVTVKGSTVSFTVRSTSTKAHAIAVTVHQPAGYTDGDADDNTTGSATWSPHTYDVALGDLDATTTSTTADASGDQTFTALLARDGYTGDIGFTLSKGPADLTLKSSSVSGDTVTFVVHSTRADQGKAPFTVTAGPAGAYPDPDAGNNDGAGTYSYFVTPPPSTDAKILLVTTSDGNSGKGTALATVLAPVGGKAHLVASFDPDEVEVTAPSGCSVALGTVTCSYTGSGGPTLFKLELVGRPGQHGVSSTVEFDLTVDGYVESSPADNHASMELFRK